MLNKHIRAAMLVMLMTLATVITTAPQRAYATATPMPAPVARFFDINGNPLAGGYVYTYAAGTTTPMASYTDQSATVQNSNPVILDSSGAAQIWLSGSYKINVLDINNVQQPNYPVDNVADFHTIDNITATSTTSLSISTTTATRTFTTQNGKYFSVGAPVFIIATGSITNNMYGQVTSYIGNQLVVSIISGNGSGTFASWTITLSGTPGPQGATGASGAGSGDMLGASNLAVGAGGVANAATARTNLGLGTSATHDTGTSAGNIPLLDGSAKLPAVDGSLLTNLAGIPVVTTGVPGKIIFGAITLQWGTGIGNPSGTLASSFGTAFSGTPYMVWGQAPNSTNGLGCPTGSWTSTTFKCLAGNGSGGNEPFNYMALGPT